MNNYRTEAQPYILSVFFYLFHRIPHILDFVIALEKI